MQTNILGLSPNEKKIFTLLQKEKSTPLILSKVSRIPRPTVYITLDSLKGRGLVEKRKDQGKSYFRVADFHVLEASLQDAKKLLLGVPDGRQELSHNNTPLVFLHRGRVAIEALLRHIFENHKNQKMYGLQGNRSTDAWEGLIDVATINNLNHSIKKNHIIVYAFLETGWVLSSAKKFGMEWVKSFEGRTTSVHDVPEKYMNYSTEIWLFKDSLYMLAPKEEVVIELRNSELVLMMKTLFSFIEDHTKQIDVNYLLRGFLNK